MSIENFRYEEPSPDMMAQAEKGKKEKTGKPADGRDVGSPDEANTGGEKKDEIKKDDKEVVPTPENMYERLRREHGRVELAVSENPDWPPAKGNPEAEEQLAGDLEKGLNSVT